MVLSECWFYCYFIIPDFNVFSWLCLLFHTLTVNRLTLKGRNGLRGNKSWTRHLSNFIVSLFRVSLLVLSAFNFKKLQSLKTPLNVHNINFKRDWGRCKLKGTVRNFWSWVEWGTLKLPNYPFNVCKLNWLLSNLNLHCTHCNFCHRVPILKMVWTGFSGRMVAGYNEDLFKASAAAHKTLNHIYKHGDGCCRKLPTIHKTQLWGGDNAFL